MRYNGRVQHQPHLSRRLIAAFAIASALVVAGCSDEPSLYEKSCDEVLAASRAFLDRDTELMADHYETARTYAIRAHNADPGDETIAELRRALDERDPSVPQDFSLQLALDTCASQ